MRLLHKARATSRRLNFWRESPADECRTTIVLCRLVLLQLMLAWPFNIEGVKSVLPPQLPSAAALAAAALSPMLLQQLEVPLLRRSNLDELTAAACMTAALQGLHSNTRSSSTTAAALHTR